MKNIFWIRRTRKITKDDNIEPWKGCRLCAIYLHKYCLYTRSYNFDKNICGVYTNDYNYELISIIVFTLFLCGVMLCLM